MVAYIQNYRISPHLITTTWYAIIFLTIEHLSTIMWKQKKWT